MELGRVAGMGEPFATMARCNAKARAASDAAKSDRISRSVPADLLLLQAPARLDRIEVMRVRREVDDADAAGRAESDDPLVVMRREIVEQQDVAPLELGEQLFGEPIDEALLVRAGKHRGEEDPAGQPHRAKEREVLAPVHGRALDVFAPLLHPGVAPGHRDVEPRLVEENQPARRHAADQAPEGFSLRNDVGTELLQGTKTFFFTTYPARYSARLMLDTWRRCLPRLCRLYSAVISPAFPSGRRARIASNSSRETLEGVPPPFLRGLTWPSRRNCHTQRFAVASPIQKRRASRMYTPSPRSCASTSLCLNSIGWASAMPRLALLCQLLGWTKPKRIDRLRSGDCLVDRVVISTGHANTPRPGRAGSTREVPRRHRRDPRA